VADAVVADGDVVGVLGSTTRHGPSRLPVVSLACRPLPCSRRPLPGFHRPVGTRRPWHTPSARWPRKLLVPAHSGSPIRVPPTTPLLTPLFSLPFTFLLPITLHPSWSLMGLVFLSRPWVPPALMALFVFLMFLWHLLWFITFFLFVDLLLTIPVLWSLTLPVSLSEIWLPAVLCFGVTARVPFTPFASHRLLRLPRRPHCQLLSPPLLPPLLGTGDSAILVVKP
jgi:hypothetical protein